MSGFRVFRWDVKPRPRHPRMNSGASPLFHCLLFKIYATANNPAITEMASNAGVLASFFVDVGIPFGCFSDFTVGDDVGSLYSLSDKVLVVLAGRLVPVTWTVSPGAN